MSFIAGEQVVPADLPKPLRCRVVSADWVAESEIQVLELEPLEGPWPRGTRLIRLAADVRPAPGAAAIEEARAAWRLDGAEMALSGCG